MRRLLVCTLLGALVLAVRAAPAPVYTDEITVDTVFDAAPVASNASTLDTTSILTYFWTLSGAFSTFKPGLFLIFK